jgi:hypothetical protein
MPKTFQDYANAKKPKWDETQYFIIETALPYLSSNANKSDSHEHTRYNESLKYVVIPIKKLLAESAKEYVRRYPQNYAFR